MTTTHAPAAEASTPVTATSVDVVVVGSGAAALSAAISAYDRGSDVLILEADTHIGGATAISGGQPWIPINDHFAEIGATDSREDVDLYLSHITSGREQNPARLAAFVDRAAEAVRYLEAQTPLKFTVCTTFSDYHADLPGGKMRGRSLDVLPFPARDELGEWDTLIHASRQLPSLTLDEMSGAGGSANPKDVGTLAVAAGTNDLATSLVDLIAQRDAAGIRTCGGALIGALLKGCLARGIPIRVSARAESLVVEDETVVGVRVRSNDGEVVVRARQGVVLASGGFEWNADLVKRFINVIDLKPLSPPTLKGDALLMGLEIGAAVANMSVLWSNPATYDEVSTYESGESFFMMNSPRQEPGVIVVNKRGERFTNEAIAYNHMPLAFRVFESKTSSFPNEEGWMIFDQRVRDRTAIADLQPGEPTPAWVTESDTIDGLADKLGIDPQTLAKTVSRWNANVAEEVDADFGRGTVWFEAWTAGGPSPRLLAPIDTPRYYAMRLYDGALGTAGGLDTDEYGRVKRFRGGVIPGLYAAGNAAASVYGIGYPGGGATIGQALTFGYSVGEHAAARARAAVQLTH
ncbi:MAG: FAD-dependent oxidoreductase [Hyphomicrobiales bacterium]|nr:MAG: FAD-dependent oxidoreductase [Hyphomicrobiales bacterium]